MRYPDTTLVKLYHHKIKYLLKPPVKILDYGCGNGTNVFFFRDMGFGVVGVDINKKAIVKAKIQNERFLLGRRFGPEAGATFNVISSEVSEDDSFGSGEFDIVLSWHTLYYLSDSDLRKRVQSFYNNLKPGGLFIATLVGQQTANYKDTIKAEDGLRKVPIIDRIKDIHGKDHYVNFTDGADELIDKFKLFTPVYVGYLDEAFDKDDNLFHYIFVGRK